MNLTRKALRPVDTEAGHSGALAADSPSLSTDQHEEQQNHQGAASSRKRRALPTFAHPAFLHDPETTNHQAELFYLQKQIQLQTKIVLVLEDGQQIQGVIEWYDRHCIKVRGRTRALIYKSAIKYIYKSGELGSAPER